MTNIVAVEGRAIKIYGSIKDCLCTEPLATGRYKLITLRDGRRSESEVTREEAILLVKCAKAHAKEVHMDALKRDLYHLDKIITKMEDD